jgi:hypothetical protein
VTLPDTDAARIRRWIDTRNDGVPGRPVGLIRYEMDVDPGSVTILECRPPCQEDLGPELTRSPVARLRYIASRKEWSLYWPDRNIKSHLYDLVQPTHNVERLLAEIDANPTRIFGR